MKQRMLRLLMVLLPSIATAQKAVPIDLARIDDSAQFAFLAPIVRDVDVVSLGESIHLTREFPLVRRGIIQYLARTSGFRMIALEGSPVDLWATQDRLLASTRDSAAIAEAFGGIFMIWNTGEVRDLMKFVVNSWTLPDPVYVTAYDVQPGTGFATRRVAAFNLFSERLSKYAPPPADVDADKLVASLGLLTRGCDGYQAGDSTRVRDAIDGLDRWIAVAAPAVERAYPTLPHAAVLKIVPRNIEGSLRLCQVMTQTTGPTNWPKYKATRDQNAGTYALALRRVAPNGKMFVWAHLSHVNHNSSGRSTSAGQILHDSLGTRLFTIMPFAEGGWTTLIFSDVNEDIGYARVGGGRGALADHLKGLAPGDFFLDLRPLQSDTLFSRPQPVWVESHRMPIATARDFDAIIWIRSVSSPTWNDPKAPRMFAMMTVIHYKWWVIVPLIVLAGRGIYRWFARRRTSSHPNHATTTAA
jgi:erythromycin esterase-like protein